MATVRSWELTNTLKDWRSWENTSLGGDLYSWEVIFETRGDTSIFAGGLGAGAYNVIETVTIGTAGNASDFGDLQGAARRPSCTANGINDRSVIYESTTDESTYKNVIDYITISTPGNASDFGDTSYSRHGGGACSNRTNNRGVFCCGEGGGVESNVMDYVTISTTGNATTYGQISIPKGDSWDWGGNGGTSNGEGNRGIFIGDERSIEVDNIQYITISSLGNSIDFGSLDVVYRDSGYAACSNGTRNRGCITDIIAYSIPVMTNCIYYITISTTGNALDFGDFTHISDRGCSVSNCSGNRGLQAGGYDTTEHYINNIDYWSISTLGNAADFGDLTAIKGYVRGASNA
jgi:hypothetical protein